MALIMQSEHEIAIRRYGEQGYPHEVCGLLLGRLAPNDARIVVEVYPLENERDDSRENRYFVSGLSMLRAERYADTTGLAIVGYYHSHPNAPARPSGYDLDHATWPNISYPIVSVVDGTAVALASWELDEDRSRFLAEPFEARDGLVSLTATTLDGEEKRRNSTHGSNR